MTKRGWKTIIGVMAGFTAGTIVWVLTNSIETSLMGGVVGSAVPYILMEILWT